MRGFLDLDNPPLDKVRLLKLWYPVLSIESVLHYCPLFIVPCLFLRNILLGSNIWKIKHLSGILLIFYITIWRTHKFQYFFIVGLQFLLIERILLASQRVMNIILVHNLNEFISFLFQKHFLFLLTLLLFQHQLVIQMVILVLLIQQILKLNFSIEIYLLCMLLNETLNILKLLFYFSFLINLQFFNDFPLVELINLNLFTILQTNLSNFILSIYSLIYFLEIIKKISALKFIYCLSNIVILSLVNFTSLRHIN